MSIKDISVLTGLSIGKVKSVIKNKPKLKKGKKSKLSKEHINFLTDAKTLKCWKTNTLQERVVLFHRQFNELKISTFTLRRIYKEHGIQFKKCYSKAYLTEEKKKSVIESQINAI
jgi:transposase